MNETRKLMNILMLFLPLPIFWAIFEQQSSRWLYQASKMNGDIGILIIQPDQVGTLNSFLILVLIPIFETVVYPVLSMIGIRRPLQRMAMGGFCICIAFFISALVQFKIEASPDKSVSMLWLVPQYVVITISEIMFSITCYSFSYEQAPKSMKSVVQAFLLLTIAFGNLIVLFTVEFTFFESQAYEFLLFTGIMFLGMLVFIAIGYNFKSQTENEVEPED